MYEQVINTLNSGVFSEDDADFIKERAKECDELFTTGILTKDNSKIVKAEYLRKEIANTIYFLQTYSYDPREDISTYETCYY